MLKPLLERLRHAALPYRWGFPLQLTVRNGGSSFTICRICSTSWTWSLSPYQIGCSRYQSGIHALHFGLPDQACLVDLPEEEVTGRRREHRSPKCNPLLQLP